MLAARRGQDRFAPGSHAQCDCLVGGGVARMQAQHDPRRPRRRELRDAAQVELHLSPAQRVAQPDRLLHRLRIAVDARSRALAGRARA